VSDHDHGHQHHDDHQAAGSGINVSWMHDNIDLLTVGIDIGSSTSHMIFSRLHLQRIMQGLSSNFVVTERSTEWTSNVILTPYLGEDEIDADALGIFVASGYEQSGIDPSEVDTGVVICTGNALKRKNALSIANVFADSSGRFVCALAGHHRESVMAAMGSGSATLSEVTGEAVVNIDVGGGTTKLALLENGEVQTTAALEIGARMVVVDENRTIIDVKPECARIAALAGVTIAVGQILDSETEIRIADVSAMIIEQIVTNQSVDPAAAPLWVTDPFAMDEQPPIVTFSGGVSEYVYGRETADYGDLGPALGAALAQRFALLDPKPKVHELELGIRATAVGLSQFSVQASGSTVTVSDSSMLPIRNVPVVLTPVSVSEDSTAEDLSRQLRAAIEADDLQPVDDIAVQVIWDAPPLYGLLRSLAQSIKDVLVESPTVRPLVIVMDIDLAASLGRLFADEVPMTRPYVCLDGIESSSCDYMDIGELILPSMVLPVIVKSMLFDSFEAQESRVG
jgi:ethanolamine utilization protein EutA